MSAALPFPSAEVSNIPWTIESTDWMTGTNLNNIFEVQAQANVHIQAIVGISSLAAGPVIGAAGKFLLPELSAATLGELGEAAVGIAGPKVGIRLPGSETTLFPDRLTLTSLDEVKNVASLSYTMQLRTYSEFSSLTGRVFNLWVRPTTRLSGPLRDAISAGDVNLNFIPSAP